LASWPLEWYVLAGLVALLVGVPLLPPAAQDGVHALYTPAAVLAGAGLLGLRNRAARK
jgi:hypothetical protein